MLLALLVCHPVGAETPSFSSAQLDRLVGRIALFPDPLLAQLFAAITFDDEIPAAMLWADRHTDLAGENLAEAMRAAQLAWAPSVQALLPFPIVLDRIVADTNWMKDLSTAILVEQREVLNAVQRQRGKAVAFGYLRSDGHNLVDSTSYISILPIKPAYIFVPSYDPDVVFVPPNPAAGIADPVTYGSAVNVGGFQPFGWKSKRWESLASYFQPWGWGQAGIDWSMGFIIINDAPWGRTLDNRRDYVHPYPDLKRIAPAQ
jgi:hypothetical protein